jgi:O-antigen/teichoic acid export membrane protein
MDEKRRHIVRWVSTAAVWSYAGVFVDRIIRFLVFLVVARFISPPQFGMVLLSLLVVELFQTFLDAGLSTALIQQGTLAKSTLDTAFVIALAVSLVTTCVLLWSAQHLANFANDTAASSFLRVLALVPLINGAGAVHVAIIHREVRFKALAGRTAISSIVASSAAVIMAFAGFGAWALVGRTLLSAFFGTIVAWCSTSYRPAMQFDLGSIRPVLPAAVRLWSTSVANQINSRGFDLLAALFLGIDALGALRIAGQVVMLLVDITIGPMTAVGYSVLSRTQDDRKIFEETLDVIASCAALLIFPAFTGLLITGDILLPLMFGSRWEPAAQIIPYMSAVGPALYWYLIVSVALFASGRMDRMLHWALLEAGLTLIFGVIAGAFFGLAGLAAAGVLRLYVMTPLGWRWLKKDVGINPGKLVRNAVPAAMASLIMAAIVELTRISLAHTLTSPTLIVSLIAVGVVTYALLLPWSARHLFAELFEQVRLSRSRKWSSASET